MPHVPEPSSEAPVLTVVVVLQASLLWNYMSLMWLSCDMCDGSLLKGSVTKWLHDALVGKTALHVV